MSFHDLNGPRRDAPAVVDESGNVLSYAQLDERVDVAADSLRRIGERSLGFLFCTNRVAHLVAYLAALRAEHVPLLLPVDMPTALRDELRRTYRPAWVVGAHKGGEQRGGQDGQVQPDSGIDIEVTGHAACVLHADLGLLLSTSGTTGSARLVRLSRRAVQANAESIAQYLALGEGERAVTTLPPSYSYGLSVVNSHLQAGGCLVLTEQGVLSREFWATVQRHAVTSLAGVPATHQMLLRTGFERMALPSLRTFTQAGGALGERDAKALCGLAAARGWRFFVMYGQTEATARISYVPPQRLADKIGSIGVAIPRGELSVDAANGELIYRGPNVMMGYASGPDDLARGDELHGVLRTGDLGRCDADGFFHVTGRLKRFIKLAGLRVGLDEVERGLHGATGLPVSAGGCDDKLVVWLECDGGAQQELASAWMREMYGLHRSLFRVHCVPQLPLLANGKRDYRPLLEAA